MEHSGMVHALGEIHQVLKPNGALIDLRPVEANWAVEVVSREGYQSAGRLEDQPSAVADDEAAFKAMAAAEANGWFIREREEEFDYFYHWDTPSEMKEFIETEWEEFEKMEEAVYRKAASLWVSASGDATVRIRVRMLITRWKKI